MGGWDAVSAQGRVCAYLAFGKLRSCKQGAKLKHARWFGRPLQLRLLAVALRFLRVCLRARAGWGFAR
eukprot:7096350-Alexandrium_andersonii.AAC.1